MTFLRLILPVLYLVKVNATHTRKMNERKKERKERKKRGAWGSSLQSSVSFFLFVFINCVGNLQLDVPRQLQRRKNNEELLFPLGATLAHFLPQFGIVAFLRLCSFSFASLPVSFCSSEFMTFLLLVLSFFSFASVTTSTSCFFLFF